MYELLKTNFLTYLFVTVITAFSAFSVGIVVIKNTNKIEHRCVKVALRILICCVISFFWLYFIVYSNLYPVSLPASSSTLGFIILHTPHQSA